MNKILIIEDDLEINALLADFLKEKGYAVHCQYDGLHVLDFLNKEKIDLIILDIMLPYRFYLMYARNLRYLLLLFQRKKLHKIKSTCFVWEQTIISQNLLIWKKCLPELKVICEEYNFKIARQNVCNITI